MVIDLISIAPLLETDTDTVSILIKQNLENYEEHGTVLASTFRRLIDLYRTYTAPGCFYLVAKNSKTNQCIGGIGVGPLHGLPVSEGVAEIRDMIVDINYQGQGIGGKLLQAALDEISNLKYKRVYLETTPKMEYARKLFLRTGLRPVIEEGADKNALPCYFIKETMHFTKEDKEHFNE